MKYEIINRNEAHARGLRKFYTGRPCKYGHDAQRFVSTGNCVECGRERAQRYASVGDREAGKFVYPLRDPADHAAAWAYCQALDMARGYTPTPAPTAPPSPSLQDLEAARRKAFGVTDYVEPPRALDPAVAQQLREAGLL